MPLIIAGEYCSPTSCADTDRITIKNVVTDFGAVTSRANWTVLYSPNSGQFSNVFERFWSLCGGTVKCGNTDTRGASGSHIAYRTHDARQNGGKLAHGHELYGFFKPAGKTQVDSAKTGISYCNPKNIDNVCSIPK